MVELGGYRGVSRALLESMAVSIGDRILVTSAKGPYEGTLMPRYVYSDDKHIVIKLRNGYNIGISVEAIQGITRLSEGVMPTFTPPSVPGVNPTLPRVSIISMGGTIASRVDYRSGAVHPALTAIELYSIVPELSRCAQIDCEVLYSMYSENVSPVHWSSMANKVAEKVKEDVKGVILTHGTDTMAYTAAALSFSLLDIPIPVILVGAQRSSDRPSSDAAFNLLGAVMVAAHAPFSGVYLAMHSDMSDDELAVHLGTKVRKNHTSRRDAFESVNTTPAAYFKKGVVEQIIPSLPSRKDTSIFEPKPRFEEKVVLLKFHPGFDSTIIDFIVEKKNRGIVFEGTGLGHVGNSCFEAIKRAVDTGIFVGMTSQCLSGGVRMTVYETGRDLLSMGVVALGDMLPETALVKLMWVLANTEDCDVKTLMEKNIAGEYCERQIMERRPVR